MKDLGNKKSALILPVVGELLVSEKAVYGETRYTPENAIAKAFLALRKGDKTFSRSILIRIERTLGYSVKIVVDSPFTGNA